MKKAEEVVPKGPYCYGSNGYLCPFWGCRDDKPEQLNGYCSYLEIEDWTDKGLGELWDQVKECGINEGWEDENVL